MCFRDVQFVTAVRCHVVGGGFTSRTCKQWAEFLLGQTVNSLKLKSHMPPSRCSLRELCCAALPVQTDQ